MFHRVEVVSVSGVLAAGEDEADLVAFEVDLNEGRFDQVGDGPKESEPLPLFLLPLRKQWRQYAKRRYSTVQRRAIPAGYKENHQ